MKSNLFVVIPKLFIGIYIFKLDTPVFVNFILLIDVNLALTSDISRNLTFKLSVLFVNDITVNSRHNEVLGTSGLLRYNRSSL